MLVDAKLTRRQALGEYRRVSADAAEDLGWEEAINGIDRASLRAGIRARYCRLLERASREEREDAEAIRRYWRQRIKNHLSPG